MIASRSISAVVCAVLDFIDETVVNARHDPTTAAGGLPRRIAAAPVQRDTRRNINDNNRTIDID